jgi:hypothetical protein
MYGIRICFSLFTFWLCWVLTRWLGLGFRVGVEWSLPCLSPCLLNVSVFQRLITTFILNLQLYAGLNVSLIAFPRAPFIPLIVIRRSDSNNYFPRRNCFPRTSSYIYTIYPWKTKLGILLVQFPVRWLVALWFVAFLDIRSPRNLQNNKRLVGSWGCRPYPHSDA